MSSKSFLLALISVFALSVIGYSQSKGELDKLDEAAFLALESNDSQAQKKANELLLAAQKANSPKHQINAYTILGIINKNKGYYITSVDYYNNALKVAEQSQDEGRISACYNNIGSVYQIQENYSQALSFYQKSLIIEEKLSNPLQKSIRLYNIGEIYREMDSLSLSLSNFNNSLIIEKEYKNEEGIVYALLGIADVYLQLNRPTDASISLDDAKSYFKKSDVETSILYYILRGELLYKQGKLDQALSTLRKAKELSKKNEFRVHLMEIYEKESDIKAAQEKQGKDKKESEKEASDSSLLIFSLGGFVLIILAFVVFRNRKSKKKQSISSTPNEQITKEEGKVFKLESDKGKVRIELKLSSILCFEANDNYVNIYHLLEDDSLKKSMERISLKKIEEQLESLEVQFSRVHKSYLINPERIVKIQGKAQAYRISLEHIEKQIPVSRNFDISQF